MSRLLAQRHLRGSILFKTTQVCRRSTSSAAPFLYHAVIGPVLEYAAPVWNHLLAKTQIDQIESIQRRALRIIYSYTSDMSYTSALYCAAVPSLADRREHLARKFLKSVLDPSSCLFTLLPTPPDPSITARLRCANTSSLASPPVPENTRHLSPTLSSITNLHIHKLFFFLIVYIVCVLYRHFVSICCCFVTCYCPVLLCYLVSRPLQVE